MKVATAQQMREIDRAAMDRGVAGIVLMENAGCAVVEAVLDLLADAPGDPTIVIVAGKGNNGGDGLVVARHLHNRGYDVQVCLLCRGDELSGDAATNYSAARSYGVPIAEQCSLRELGEALAAADLVVDAILGTGISGEVRGMAAEAIRAINDCSAPVVAVDIASGVDADTGAICGLAVRADVTVTFGLPKVGNVIYPGAAYCGELRIADISLPTDCLTDPAIRTNLILEDVAAASLPPRREDMHKGDAGRVLIIAGSRGYTGAAALAASGALRAGAGLVYLAVPESCNAVLEAKCTEAISLPMPDNDAGCLTPAAAKPILDFASTVDAVLIGPGLSRHPDTAALVPAVVSGTDQPVVVDADALNCLSDTGTQPLHHTSPTVITPHPGELSRLTGQSIADIQSDRLSAARSAAEQFGAVTVLKGAGTVVALPDGEAWINTTGHDALASGGSGDVLAGMIAAFIAGGSSPEDACIAAVYYHGRAGEAAAKRSSRRSVIASDLLSAIGRVFPDS